MSIRIALAGNPNCGKTTMFNALTGANQYVGNWPGVTVEKKEGRLKTSKGDEEIIITDLPGIYSLSPYTLEEVVSRDYLLKERPDRAPGPGDGTAGSCPGGEHRRAADRCAVSPSYGGVHGNGDL